MLSHWQTGSPGLSASAIGRLKGAGSSPPSATATSGSAVSTALARVEDEAPCLLVIIGATPESRKELVGRIEGVREALAFHDFTAGSICERPTRTRAKSVGHSDVISPGVPI